VKELENPERNGKRDNFITRSMKKEIHSVPLESSLPIKVGSLNSG
jgi:hypothetical protein